MKNIGNRKVPSFSRTFFFITGLNSNSTTPGKGRTPTGGDRFISNRSAVNLELAQYKVHFIAREKSFCIKFYRKRYSR